MRWWEYILVLWTFGAFTLLTLYPFTSKLVQNTYLPVVSEMTVLSHKEVDNGIIISAKATKFRECNWKSSEWYLGERDGANVFLPEARHNDAPQLRTVGELYWDNIYIPVKPYQVYEREVFADTVHLCNGVEVRSRFWN